MRGPWTFLGAAGALIAALLTGLGAEAQTAVQQSGAVTPFHGTAWYNNGIVGDAGTAATPFVSSLGMFNGSTCPFGISSQTGPGATSAAHSLFSVCQTAGATTLNFLGLNGQPAPSVFFNINGTVYPFPGPGLGSVTSVNVSPGSTGLTATGGPVTTSGTITLGGKLNIANGGTGQTTATGAINALLPSQTGNFGNVLGTNGTSSAWVTSASLLPSQTGQSGKFLTTNGTLTSWGTPAAGSVTSITAGTGLVGGTITTSGTIGVDPTIVGFQALSNTWTSFNQHTAGTSTANTVWDEWKPSDYGTGKPGLSIQKDATATSWTLGLFDGSSNNGTIHLSASTIAVPSALTVGGSITLSGSAVCTMATGCPGGGGGGGYATIFDVAATYGGDPAGSADTVTPFNNALAACSGTGGGIIWFRGGTFRFNSGVVSNVNGCRTEGVGSAATIFNQTFAGNLITVAAQYSGVSNVQFTQSGAMSSGFGIAEEGFNDIYENIFFNGLFDNIHITNSSESAWTNIYERSSTGTQGVLCDSAVGTVFGARFDHVSSEGAGNNGYTHFTQGAGCNTLQVSRSYGGNGNNCVNITSGAGAFFIAEDLECDHNQEAFFINGGTGIQVSDSFIGSGLGNNGFDFSSGFSGFATITNNHIRDNLNAGIFLGASGGVSIVGNVISGNGAGGVNVAGGVGHFNINSNQIGVPGDPTQADCINVASGASDYYTITSNVCGATNSSGVTDGGSGSKKSVTGNVGP